jgi:hypothetical protein
VAEQRSFLPYRKVFPDHGCHDGGVTQELARCRPLDIRADSGDERIEPNNTFWEVRGQEPKPINVPVRHRIAVIAPWCDVRHWNIYPGIKGWQRVLEKIDVPALLRHGQNGGYLACQS